MFTQSKSILLGSNNLPSKMMFIPVIFLLILMENSFSSPIGMLSTNRFGSVLEIFNPSFNKLKGIHPDLIQISIKKLKNFDNSDDGISNEERQIPVISDIERIKKVIEIIEFVGEKVGDLIDQIQVPDTNPNDTTYDDRSLENITLEA